MAVCVWALSNKYGGGDEAERATRVGPPPVGGTHGEQTPRVAPAQLRVLLVCHVTGCVDVTNGRYGLSTCTVTIGAQRAHVVWFLLLAVVGSL